jgi:glutamate/tyrosine decarboxylase-like PLP-dependent enzyme
MHLSCRRFLALFSLGIATASSGCHSPDAKDVSLDQTLTNHSGLTNRITLARQKHLLLGYPANMTPPPEAFFSWRRELYEAGINQFVFNNAGNPFADSPIPFNTYDFEREVIQFFAKVFGFPNNDNWGFLSNSGTDSNMHGMYMGRLLLTARTGAAPKAYFTKEAHYSIQILRSLLNMEMVQVATLADGGMDSADLAECLAANRDHPALVVATLGTTFKGAIDNLDAIQNVLQGVNSYVHLDAALFGGYLPHTPFAAEVLHQNKNKRRYDSIAVSCHKFFGFPSPAGLFITRNTTYQEFNKLFSRIHNPEYIHHVPGTITCSRDGVKAAEFYFFTTDSAFAKQAADANNILQLTAKLYQQMQTRLPMLQATRANQASNTLYFKKPSSAIVKKFSLATMRLITPTGAGDYAHAVIMPHVTGRVIEEFLADLEADKKSTAV